MRIKKKKWTEPYLNENAEKILLSPVFSFEIDQAKTNVLEIGSGKGGFILGMGNRYPDYAFYGIERNADVIAMALKKVISEEQNRNIFLMRADFGEAKQSIEPNSFDYIFISHPDPWPKKRHSKRRLLSLTFLADYFRILKPGGLLFFKTDNADLFVDSIESIQAFGNFTLVSRDEDYQNKEEFDVLTEYEEKFRSLGTKIKRLVLKKED